MLYERLVDESRGEDGEEDQPERTFAGKLPRDSPVETRRLLAAAGRIASLERRIGEEKNHQGLYLTHMMLMQKLKIYILLI